MSYVVHIEPKSRDVYKAARSVFQVLKEIGAPDRWVATSELLSAGVPIDVAAPALLHLASLLNADVRSGESGGLEFNFPSLDRAPWVLQLPAFIQPTLHQMTRVGQGLGIASLGFGTSAALGALLLLYFFMLMPYLPTGALITKLVGFLFGVLIFLALVPVQIVALIGVGLVGIFGALGSVTTNPLGLILIPVFLLLLVPMLFGVGFSYQLSLIWWKWLSRLFKNFLNFGYEKRAPLKDEQEFISLLLAKKGRIRIGDLMVLFGWSRDQAFKELTQLMLDYGGDVEVTEEGKMIFEFKELLERASQSDARPPAPIWEREERPSVRFDKAARRADLWTLLFWFLGLVLPFLQIANTTGVGSKLGLGFGAFMVFVPLYILTRRAVVAARDAAYAQRERYLEWLKLIVEDGGRIKARADELDTQTILDFGGDIDEASAEGDQVVFVFRELEPALESSTK